jgi:hypothetical protein
MTTNGKGNDPLHLVEMKAITNYGSLYKKRIYAGQRNDSVKQIKG